MTGAAAAEALDRLVQRYLDRAPRDYARACWAEATDPASDR